MKPQYPFPTDRFGSKYYGCRTFAEANREIQGVRARASLGDDYAFDLNKYVTHIAQQMQNAGYKWAASRLLREYGLK